MRRIFLASLVVGILDITEVCIFYGLRNGVAPPRIFQSVAAGLLGRTAAVAGGWPTALLGLGLHFFIAFGVVATYALVARRVSALFRHPIPLGVTYGLVVYAVMNYVVLPLSAVVRNPQPWDVIANGLFAHIVCVGLPTVLILARWRPGGMSVVVP